MKVSTWIRPLQKNDLNNHQKSVTKNLQPVSCEISTDRLLVTKERNLSSNATTLDLN